MFVNPGDIGLFRMRTSGARTLIYVGEGRIRDRTKAHLRKGTHLEHPQYQSFRDASFIELSYATRPNLLMHQRLEIETDLIGAHVVEHRAVPLAQFLGQLPPRRLWGHTYMMRVFSRHVSVLQEHKYGLCFDYHHLTSTLLSPPCSSGVCSLPLAAASSLTLE